MPSLCEVLGQDKGIREAEGVQQSVNSSSDAAVLARQLPRCAVVMDVRC